MSVFGVLAVLLAVVVIYPRTPSPSGGYIYCGNITQHNSNDEFHEAVTSLDDDEAIEALNKENYSLAEVAEKKYTCLRQSLRATIAMVLSATAGSLVFII
jgi:hypothetical protein